MSTNPWIRGLKSLVEDPLKAINNAETRATQSLGESLNPLDSWRAYLTPQNLWETQRAQAAEPTGSTPGDMGMGEFGPAQPEQGTPAGSAGTAGMTYSPNLAVLGGVQYDLNDPGQFQAYLSAADEVLNADFDYFSKKSKDLRDTDIAEAKAQEDEILFNIDRALSKLSEQEGQYGQDFTRSVSDLAEGYRQGSARRQSFYASIAPRVYQSSQGTSQDYAENKWKEANTRLGEDKMRAEQGFSEARSDYGRQREKTSNEFNLFKTRREAQTEDEIANQARSVQGQRDQAMSGAFNYAGEMRQKTGQSNKWANPQFQERNLDYSPSQVNLNDLMSFIKFQPAGMPTGGSQMTSKAIATPEAGGQSLQNYLGYGQDQETNPLNLYKQGLS
jgi:hypothetical protein